MGGRKAIDLTNQRFGRLVVLRRADCANGHARWHCQCDCGGQTVVESYPLRRAKVVSCGCANRDRVASLNLSHGEASQETPEYRAWASMLSRCTNPSHKSFANYGGRGIGACRRWLESYRAFLEDMGRRPTPKHSIDRINNDGDYEPGNCRWATATTQQNNRRNTLARFEGSPDVTGHA